MKAWRRCTSCAGTGIYVWTDLSGLARGGTCEKCHGTGAERIIKEKKGTKKP